MELRDFNKHFVKNARKKNSKFNPKSDLTQIWTKLRPFPKLEHVFWLSKREREGLLSLSSCMPVNILNMHQYPWIRINILENAWINCSGYARTMNIHDHLHVRQNFKDIHWVLNKSGFQIWHSCVSKGYAEFRICLIMAR